MSVKEKAKHILFELRAHAPFTLLGAALGIVFMLIFAQIGPIKSRTLFAVFHPTHVVLSAMVTASIFKLHSASKRIVYVIIVGYLGSIGIATLSDIIIPHIGSRILRLDIPTHAELHELTHAENAPEGLENADSYTSVAPHTHTEGAAAEPEKRPQTNRPPRTETAQINYPEHPETNRVGHTEYSHNTDPENPEATHARADHRIHFGFIDEWYIVNPAAFLGIFIALFLPRTKFPHSGHVLISTWASSSYLLMNLEAELTAATIAGVFAVLFLAVWLPCCISDIVFPLLFVNSDLELAAPSPHHGLHSHPHIETGPQEGSQ